jgi:hypothetical protein
MWMDSFGSGYGPVAASCEESNAPSVSIKDKERLTTLETISFSRRILFHGVSPLRGKPHNCSILVEMQNNCGKER